MYQLKNNGLKLEVHPQGAELFSIKDTTTNREYLWQGDEAYWGRRAPVLFPFVGTPVIFTRSAPTKVIKPFG